MRCPMGLQVGRVDHDGFLFAMIGSKTGHYLSEDALVAALRATKEFDVHFHYWSNSYYSRLSDHPLLKEVGASP
ncbi:hypothetical protein RUE5091_04242 [Ruegeria denitrificans]|uniref:Uncharacterized protein n=1 Tax=Ruegeria denitrificans TaxID=1715692 RepID=A0A0P1IJX5_9RHOB|nr:hypothetical protein RUE5091_04242 [Ruegeria denitrificans]